MEIVVGEPKRKQSQRSAVLQLSDGQDKSCPSVAYLVAPHNVIRKDTQKYRAHPMSRSDRNRKFG